jgi:hypothetical protein
VSEETSAAPAFQRDIEEARTSLAAAELFATINGAKLPAGLGSLYIGYRVSYSVFLRNRSKGERDRALTFLGETFGRADWTATMNSNGDAFNWKKTVDGVDIVIEDAQPTGQPKSFPVDPKQFPLRIEDAETESEVAK